MKVSAVVLLFTENCTEETRKSKQGRYCELVYMIFSTLKDFPKQIRIKRKYLSRLKDVSQVYKGIRRMPRRFETKKDAISCDKP